jgi:predicted transcriptional regulator
MQTPTGEDIRSARENKGLTQSELAERAGVSQPLIARIEGENVDPTIDTLYSVVSVLNSSTSELEEEEVRISMPSVLKDARKRTGYTQGELAEVADVSQPLISRIERQDVNPKHPRRGNCLVIWIHCQSLTVRRYPSSLQWNLI